MWRSLVRISGGHCLFKNFCNLLSIHSMACGVQRALMYKHYTTHTVESHRAHMISCSGTTSMLSGVHHTRNIVVHTTPITYGKQFIKHTCVTTSMLQCSVHVHVEKLLYTYNLRHCRKRTLTRVPRGLRSQCQTPLGTTEEACR